MSCFQFLPVQHHRWEYADAADSAEEVASVADKAKKTIKTYFELKIEKLRIELHRVFRMRKNEKSFMIVRLKLEKAANKKRLHARNEAA